MGAKRPLLVVAALLVIAALFAVRQSLGLDFDLESLNTAISGMGVWAPLVYIGIVAFRLPLGLPSQLVLIGGGIVFGTFSGTLYGALGLLVSAVFLFVSARYAGHEVIVRRIPRRMRPIIELAGTRVGAVFLGVGTAYPVGPMTMYHLIAGIAGMAFLAFLLAVAVGCVARSATYAFFGSRLLAGELGGLLEATAVIAVAVVVPLLFPRSRSWLLQALGRDRSPGMSGEKRERR